MATAIIRPIAYKEPSSNTNLSKVIDGDLDTKISSAKSVFFFYNFNSEITSNIVNSSAYITDIRFCAHIKRTDKDTVSVRMVDYPGSGTSYDDYGDGVLSLWTNNDAAGTETRKVSAPILTTKVNDNKNILLDENFGLRLHKAGLNTIYLHEVWLEVDYEMPTINVTANASPAEGGTVTGGGTYESGSTVTVTATPNSGYVFSHWLVNGANVGNSNPISGALTADTTVTAVFEKVQTSKIYYGDETAKSVFDTQKNKAKSVWYGTERIL